MRTILDLVRCLRTWEGRWLCFRLHRSFGPHDLIGLSLRRHSREGISPTEGHSLPCSAWTWPQPDTVLSGRGSQGLDLATASGQDSIWLGPSPSGTWQRMPFSWRDTFSGVAPSRKANEIMRPKASVEAEAQTQ